MIQLTEHKINVIILEDISNEQFETFSWLFFFFKWIFIANPFFMFRRFTNFHSLSTKESHILSD